MNRVISIDGSVVEASRAVLSVRDRGFLYGDGVFESLRVYGGRTFSLAEHMARLARSCAALGIVLPVAADEVGREIERAVAASSLAEAYVRVTVTRGTSDRTALVPLGDSVPLRVILVEPVAPPPRTVYAEGLRAITLSWNRGPDAGPASRAKILSYVTSLLALEDARARGADEAIFVGSDATVRDASTSNVFVVDAAGKLVTPSDGAGVLGGITRGHVLDLACALGMSSGVVSIAFADVMSAREVFLTSSIREIVSVVSVNGKTIGTGAPGEVARMLHRAYRHRAGASGPLPWE